MEYNTERNKNQIEALRLQNQVIRRICELRLKVSKLNPLVHENIYKIIDKDLDVIESILNNVRNDENIVLNYFKEQLLKIGNNNPNKTIKNSDYHTLLNNLKLNNKITVSEAKEVNKFLEENGIKVVSDEEEITHQRKPF
ncbi:MAG: hypothetical protein J5634_03705 [Bacilli bacterium]|nr:hypothetical protein [Bacilli bacterium]